MKKTLDQKCRENTGRKHCIGEDQKDHRSQNRGGAQRQCYSARHNVEYVDEVNEYLNAWNLKVSVTDFSKNIKDCHGGGLHKTCK